MPRLPRLSGREAVRALERVGFVRVRQRGSHVVLQHGMLTCVVPNHRELRLGTLAGILDQAELNDRRATGRTAMRDDRIDTRVFKHKIVLHTPLADPAKLEPFVEACLRDGVVLIAVLGADCVATEDLIDEIVVGEGTNQGRFMASSAHPSESLEDVLAFATSWQCHSDEGLEQVRF